MSSNFISVRGAKVHNLKNVTVDIPKNQLVVVTGVSGSGKSSLAFDTVYAEGQRRYVESLSAYARQFLEIQDKPDVESITGLSPAIAIDQKTTSRNPRSTVSTATEIYDYLRLLYARIGVPYSEATGKPIEKQTPSQIVEIINKLPKETRLYILAPIVKGQKGEHRKEFLNLQKQGFQRIKIDGNFYEFDELPALDKNLKHDIEVVVDRLEIGEELGNRLADSVETGIKLGGGLLHVEIASLPEDYEGEHQLGSILTFSEKFACPITGFTLTEIEPRIFSFNSPYGACPSCDGLGTEVYFDPDLVIAESKLSIKEGAIAPWHKTTSKYSNGPNRFYMQTLESLAQHYGFSIYTPYEDLPEEVKKVVLYGSGDEEIAFRYDDGFRKNTLKKPFEGVIKYLEERAKKTESDYVREEMSKYQSNKACSACDGMRLKKESLCVKIANVNIGEICRLTITEAVKWFETVDKKLSDKHNQIAERVLKEIRRRLGFLHDVGLEYLTLNRQSGTLSGGESQRIRLASQIGSGLSGVLYVLDEPSIGLHQCDNDRLLNTLKNLRDLGNSVVVVEHDEDTMRSSDYIIDVGPGAGIHGGNIIAVGTPEEIAGNDSSITGQYLSGAKFIPVPKTRRPGLRNKFIEIKGARANNLQNVDVKMPLGTFVAVTGVSGSGKSSLTIHTLYKAAVKRLHGAKASPGPHDLITGFEYVDKVIEIDQSPIGRTPRSNPATYTGAFTPIRDWFSAISEAKVRGYKPGRFSFNVKGGRCEACEGDGVIKIEMHFLPDVYVKCEECAGKRYNKETLEIKYKGCSIADVLDMTVDVAEEFFRKVPLIHEKLIALQEVGLGYMKVGQSATTLSGGEAQRVKLAKELSRKSTGRTLYILDEPTTGLHTDDIGKLLKVLHTLVDAGNTVVVIEHNLDVIKTADYVVDIGPYGGDKGGKLVACGTPEEVATSKESVTGSYLKRYLNSDNQPLAQAG
ncbi:MAG: excinuclease ABC subunit UvrA [Candidatus Jidaibacter sp.]|jgi:excinuclease ABC subunit A|nr:excinuclease ABC subunit UvrA [Candidatus Jidaibacter sp.]